MTKNDDASGLNMDSTHLKKGLFMDCPRCRHSLQTKKYENITVTACNHCGGFWLEPTQLQDIITLRDDHFSSNEIEQALKGAHPGITDKTTNTLLCPVCSIAMEEFNYDYSSGVLVNRCPEGHGLWFDKNELQNVEIFVEHWEDKARIHESDLIAKLNQVRIDQDALDKKEEASDSARLEKFTHINIFERIFKLFHLLKMDK